MTNRHIVLLQCHRFDDRNDIVTHFFKHVFSLRRSNLSQTGRDPNETKDSDCSSDCRIISRYSTILKEELCYSRCRPSFCVCVSTSYFLVSKLSARRIILRSSHNLFKNRKD